MNGHLIPNSCIAIDSWRIKTTTVEYIHFLTHIHSDHTVGLTSTWQKPIYCSEITAYLLIERYGVKQKLIQILPLNQSVVVQVFLSHLQSSTFTVTAFDANHCPGAIMLYFQGSFGNVLYTGDFRLSEDIIEMAKKLSGQVDTLYLDNTFCSPRCVFPSQDDCFEEIVDIIRKHPNHKVIIGLRKIGKETLLGRLGVTLNETITVSPESYKLCDLLFSTNVLTTANSSKKTSRLSVVPVEVVTRMLSILNKHSPTIGIIPTAIFTGCTENVMKNPNLYIVPYSDHCSYPELVQFVSALRPNKVLPIVTGTKGPYNSDFSDRLNMSCFDAYLSQPHAVSTNATNLLDSHTETERLTGTVTNSKLSFVKRRMLSTKKKAKAKGVVYCKGFYPIQEPIADKPSALKDGIIFEDKEASFKMCVTSGHPSIDLTAQESESGHSLNEPATQTTYDHPSDLPELINSRISQIDFCPDSLDYEKTASSSNSHEDSINVIDLTSDNKDVADFYVPSDTFQINCTLDNHEQVDSKSVLPEKTLDVNAAEQNTQLQDFGINTEVEETGKTKEKTNQLVKIRSSRHSSKTQDLSNTSKYTKCIKKLCNACDVIDMSEKNSEKVTLLMDWDSNKQVKQRGRAKRKRNRLVEIPSSKVQNRESPSKESSQSSHTRSKKKCINSEIPTILSTSISKQVPLLDVQETNNGAVHPTADTLQHCHEKKQPHSRKEEVANPSAALLPLIPQKRGRGRPKKKDQLSNDKNSKNLVSLIQADRLNRTNTHLRKSAIGKIKRENSPNAAQTKKLVSLICSAVCSALLPLRTKRLIKNEVTHDVAPASCLSGMSDSSQDALKDSLESRKWETSTTNHSLEDLNFLSASDEEYTIKKLSNQVCFNKKSLHIIDSSILVGTQDENKISESESNKLQKQICLKDSIKNTRKIDEFPKVKDTSHSTDEELGDHMCSKDRVENRNTLSKSQAASCVNLPEPSDSTSSALTNHSVLQGKVKETYIKYCAMESSSVGPEEIKDYRSVHINNDSSKQTPQGSSCLPVEFPTIKDTSHSTDEELGDHLCSKDRVENRNTLSKSQAASCVNLPELSDSTSSALTNHSVLQGKVKETYIKYCAMESSSVGPEEIRDYISVHINNDSSKQTPQGSSCLPVVRKISETICSDGDLKATLDQTSDEHSSEFTMDTVITGQGSHKSTISNKVHFCYDCFISRFPSAVIENQVNACFVCEKSVQKKIFCDQMFVNTLKDLFFRKDSVKS
ncbi:5 exonuclease Apollo [Biomphalaria glabrata]|nr:5 exonuclease Apollo [Biomphalaria glabrata]